MRYSKYGIEIYCPVCGGLQPSGEKYGRHMVQIHEQKPELIKEALGKLGYAVTIEYLTHKEDDYSGDE